MKKPIILIINVVILIIILVILVLKFSMSPIIAILIGPLAIAIILALYFQDNPKIFKLYRRGNKQFQIIVAINFILYIIITIYLGGIPSFEGNETAHYYLVNHGKYIEVPVITYLYSIVHSISIMVTIPLAGLMRFISFLSGDSNKRN